MHSLICNSDLVRSDLFPSPRNENPIALVALNIFFSALIKLEVALYGDHGSDRGYSAHIFPSLQNIPRRIAYPRHKRPWPCHSRLKRFGVFQRSKMGNKEPPAEVL